MRTSGMGVPARLPARFWAGLAMGATAWILNWGLSGVRTHVLFFPLWLGYVLAVDGLTERLTGSSPAARSPRRLVASFVLSVPLWWVFELANLRLGNWEYLGREHFGDIEYALLCSLSFSTVVPALLGTAELVRALPAVDRFPGGPRVRLRAKGLWILFLSGAAALAAMLAFPDRFYPFLWISGVFLLEPLARLWGRPALTTDLERGDWRPWIALWCAGLACGFLWELWNVGSYPRWIYHIPGIEGPKLFEMPLPGYLGYLPFALEVYLLRQLLLPEKGLLGGPVRR